VAPATEASPENAPHPAGSRVTHPDHDLELRSTKPEELVVELLVTRALVLGLALLALPQHALAEDERAFHVGLDVSWGRQNLRFLAPSALLGCEDCGMQNLRTDVVRGAGSIGVKGIALEGSIAMGLGTPFDLLTWTAGVRFDTGYRGVVSAAFRFAYLRRGGDLEGVGGRTAFALQLRVVRALVVYGEATLDVVNVPGDQETLLSYATTLGGGVRLVFAR